MSSAAQDELPPFAQPYLADFQQLARMLERIPNFILQPVEAPAPDLARVFADWLGGQGWDVHLRELPDADALRNLAAALVHPLESTGRAIVIVVQGGALDDAAARASFAALNMARDPIAQALPIPILWWGSAAFLRTTWSYAPDWWSVAATPFRIPFRSLYDLTSDMPLGAHWWTGAVSLLVGAADSVEAADAGVTIDELRRQIAMAETDGARHSEVDLRLRLAERLESGAAPSPTDALKEYVRARRLTEALGDLAATLAIDAHIILDLGLFTDEPLRAELEQFAAAAATHSDDPTSRTWSALIRAKLSLMSQAFDACERFAQEALKQAQLADQPVLAAGAHCLLAASCYLRGDFTGCLAHSTTLLAGALAADNRPLQLQARDLRIRAQAALGHSREAAHDLLDSWELLAPFDHEERIWCGFLGRAAELALQTGDSEVAAWFALLSVMVHLLAGRLPDRESLHFDLDALAANEAAAMRHLETFIEGASAGLNDPVRVRFKELWGAIQEEVRRLGEALGAAGVDAYAPDTWRSKVRNVANPQG